MVLEDAAAVSANMGFWAQVGIAAFAIILTGVIILYWYPNYKRNQALKATEGKQSATPQPRRNPKLGNRW